jgi:hypothetical protein
MGSFTTTVLRRGTGASGLHDIIVLHKKRRKRRIPSCFSAQIKSNDAAWSASRCDTSEKKVQPCSWDGLAAHRDTEYEFRLEIVDEKISIANIDTFEAFGSCLILSATKHEADIQSESLTHCCGNETTVLATGGLTPLCNDAVRTFLDGLGMFEPGDAFADLGKEHEAVRVGITSAHVP